MDALLDALLDWLAQHSDYDVTALPLPAVVELDAASLTREFYRDSPQLMPVGGVDRRVLAFYSWQRHPHGRIYLLDRALTAGGQPGKDPLSNPLFQERLLHELVHHAQYHGGAYDRFVCRGVGEREAYALGGLFLRQRDVPDPLPNRQVLAYLYSRC